MRLGKIIALTGIIIVMVAFIGGCSSDDNTVAPGVTYGSNTDSVFVPVRAQIDSVLYNFTTDIFYGLENLKIAPGNPNIEPAGLVPSGEIDIDADPDILIHTYQNDWHYVYVSYTGPNYNTCLRDSVQYLIDGQAIEDPTSAVDNMHIIDNWAYTALNQDISHTDYTGRNEFEISNLDQSVSTVSGSTNRLIMIDEIATGATSSNTYSFETIYSDVSISKTDGRWVSGCPTSGTINMTISHIYTWMDQFDVDNDNSSWTINVEFDDGKAAVTASDGTTTWQYECSVCSRSTTE